MLSIGLRPKTCGYKYIYELVKIQASGQSILPLKLKGYAALSKKYGKSVFAIDKNIQNCISRAWLDGNVEELYREFGNTIDIDKGKPTSKQLIMHICDRVCST